MASFDIELVGKIGSMALIRSQDNDIDYNIFSRLGQQLRPGMVWVSSGAVEIGRLDYMQRNAGATLSGDKNDMMTDYAAQGQAILMQNYRNFVSPVYSVRQVLLEHQHFNNKTKREHIKHMLLRCAAQNAIPIVNYNDTVSAEENRRWELSDLREHSGTKPVVECIDNDETAAVIATMLHARLFVMLTSVNGIYQNIDDPESLIPVISGKDAPEVIENIRHHQQYCVGSSREGAAGARAKLEFAIPPVQEGTTVIIAHAKYSLEDIIAGRVPRTWIGIG